MLSFNHFSQGRVNTGGDKARNNFRVGKKFHGMLSKQNIIYVMLFSWATGEHQMDDKPLLNTKKKFLWMYR